MSRPSARTKQSEAAHRSSEGMGLAGEGRCNPPQERRDLRLTNSPEIRAGSGNSVRTVPRYLKVHRDGSTNVPKQARYLSGRPFVITRTVLRPHDRRRKGGIGIVDDSWIVRPHAPRLRPNATASLDMV